LHDVEKRWHDAFTDDRRALTVECERPLPEVSASSVAVSHVLDVLLDNARQHATGAVRIAARAHHGVVSITVHDGGPGIRDTSSLFVRRHPEAGGNGIGLALARRLVEAEGGRLVLRAAHPGATFDVTLPAADSREDPSDGPVP
jgi:signal transduction histidine kinase